MKCKKCGHNLLDNKKTCIYCGAIIEFDSQNQKIYPINNSQTDIALDEKTNLSKRYTKNLDLENLPTSIQDKINQAIKRGETEITIEEITDHKSSSSNNKEINELSYDTVLNLLKELRISYDAGHIRYNIFKKMAVEIIKDFISQMPDDIKVHYVINEMKNTELSAYLDDEIYHDLQIFFISK